MEQDTVESVALDREAQFEIGIEDRFPLDLTPSSAPTWEAYEAALNEVWDPEDPKLWAGFEVGGYSNEALEAGALVWSHRAWVEHSAIAESEAVLVRSCLEPGVSADFKYCLSMRAVEHARSTDLCHILATRLGHYSSTPQTDQLADLLDDELVRRVLHVQSDLDAYVGAHLVAQSTLNLRLWERARDNSDGGFRDLVDLVIRDKARMLEVAWTQMTESISDRDHVALILIAGNISHVIFLEEGRGRQLPALLDPGRDARDLDEANQLASSGLGGVVASDQREIFESSVAELTTRFATLGIDIDDPSASEQ